MGCSIVPIIVFVFPLLLWDKAAFKMVVQSKVIMFISIG